MSNAAIDILKARQTAISNDVAIKQEKLKELQKEVNDLQYNTLVLNQALQTIKDAIELLEKDAPNEPTSTRTTSKSKKATS